MEGLLATKLMIAGRFGIVVVALAGGILMIRYPTVEANLRINAAISMVNPVLLTFINLVGAGAMAGKTPVYKLVLILAGALLIVIGTRSSKKAGGPAPDRDTGEKAGDGGAADGSDRAAGQAGRALSVDAALAARAMVTVRFMIVAVALAAAILMIMFPTVEANLRINAAVALVNPLLMTSINLIGISGMAGKVSWTKLAMVAAGTVLIITGTL